MLENYEHIDNTEVSQMTMLSFTSCGWLQISLQYKKVATVAWIKISVLFQYNLKDTSMDLSSKQYYNSLNKIHL